MALAEISAADGGEVRDCSSCEGCFLNQEDAAPVIGGCALYEALETRYTPIVADTIIQIIESDVPLSMTEFGRKYHDKYPYITVSALSQRFSKATKIINESRALAQLVVRGPDGAGSVVYQADHSSLARLCPEIVAEVPRKKHSAKRRVKKTEVAPVVNEQLASLIYGFIQTGSMKDEALFSMVQGIGSESRTLSLQNALTRAIRTDAYADSLEMQDRFRIISGIAHTGNLLRLIEPEKLAKLIK